MDKQQIVSPRTNREGNASLSEDQTDKVSSRTGSTNRSLDVLSQKNSGVNAPPSRAIQSNSPNSPASPSGYPNQRPSNDFEKFDAASNFDSGTYPDRVLSSDPIIVEDSRLILKAQLDRMTRVNPEVTNNSLWSFSNSRPSGGTMVLDKNGLSTLMSKQQGQQSATTDSPITTRTVELLPGMSLNTDSENAIIRTRLANDANVVVGPNSRLVLLKPTEVRLQAGECEITVPPGDLVDVFGPEEMAGYSRYRTGPLRTYQSRGAVNRVRAIGRNVYRLDKNGIQRLDQDPPWLVDYNASWNQKQLASEAAQKQAETAATVAAEKTPSQAGGPPAKAAAPPAPSPVMKARGN